MTDETPAVEIPTKEKVVDPKVIAKLGTTMLGDASKRHSIEYFNERRASDKLETYWGLPLQIGYVIRTAWSGYFTKREAMIIEAMWDIFVEHNLDIGKVYNGYTECRYVPEDKLEEFKKKLKETFPKSEYAYGEGLIKVYLMVGYKRTTNLTMDSKVTINQ